jgi:outer membrane protein assembly factor BamB
VAAGGLIFVADESGVVRALEASGGKPRWKAYTGGAVFFPPALWEGRVYVGSADGHVYAFEAATGRPLWRFRAAPAERRIPVFGKLISTWPVAGGLVVREGVVYAAAGIAHYDGTHVYALDAVTGKVRWYNDSSGALSEKTKSGVSLQGSLYLDRGQLCFSGGNAYPTARYDLETGRCVVPAHDQVGSGFRTAFYPYYPRHARFMSLHHALADGRLLDYAADYSGSLHSTLALFGPMPAGAAPLGPDWRILPRRGEPKARPPTLWEHKSPERFTGFVVGPETLLAAGEIASGPAPGTFLAALNIEDGAPRWREQLAAPVVKGGIAVDHEARVFVSLEDGRVLCFAAQ